MEQCEDKKNNYSVINYIEGINLINKLIEEYETSDVKLRNLFFSMSFCHVLTLLDTFVKENILYDYKGNSDGKYDRCYFLNSDTLKKAIEKMYGIKYEWHQELKDYIEKRNCIMHRNGRTQDNRQIVITKQDVLDLISLVREQITTILDFLAEAKARELLKKKKKL